MASVVAFFFFFSFKDCYWPLFGIGGLSPVQTLHCAVCGRLYTEAQEKAKDKLEKLKLQEKKDEANMVCSAAQRVCMAGAEGRW